MAPLSGDTVVCGQWQLASFVISYFKFPKHTCKTKKYLVVRRHAFCGALGSRHAEFQKKSSTFLVSKTKIKGHFKTGGKAKRIKKACKEGIAAAGEKSMCTSFVLRKIFFFRTLHYSRSLYKLYIREKGCTNVKSLVISVNRKTFLTFSEQL